jgi:hypothetical protein
MSTISVQQAETEAQVTAENDIGVLHALMLLCAVCGKDCAKHAAAALTFCLKKPKWSIIALV